MKSEKLIAGIAMGAIAALILIPKTRRMLSDALGRITDSLKNISEDAGDVVEKGSMELNMIAEKAQKASDAIKETRQSWQ